MAQSKKERAQYALVWYYRNRKKVLRRSKGYAIKANYGLSVAQVHKMLREQGGRCAICQIKFQCKSLHARKGKARDFFIDHNHTSEKVRGLLCPRCNTFTGYIESRGDLIEKIYSYLRQRNG